MTNTKPQPTNQGGSPPPGKKKLTSSEKSVFIWAEGQQESGGNYLAINSNSGALGRWQVMADNLPEWGPKSGIGDPTANQYLHSEKDQDAVAWHILGGYYDTYGPAGAAAMWYSGQPDPNETYGDPSVHEYVTDVLNWMKSSPYLPAGEASLLGTGSSTVQTVGVPPPPSSKNTSWAGQVRKTGDAFSKASVTAHNQYKAVAKLRIRK